MFAVCKITIILIGTDPANGASLYERRAECPHQTTDRPVLSLGNIFRERELARQCGHKNDFKMNKECNG
jgi:hypothetical protein